MMNKLKVNNDLYTDKYIGVVDGIRALSIIIIVWYHLWQQSWITPEINIGFVRVNLDWLIRRGYELVDVMLLISSFCLFLPYARNMVYGGMDAKLSDFYKKRVARIFPSYYFSVFVTFFVAVISHQFSSTSEMLGDLIPHLFFVHNFFAKSFLWTKINVVLWTLAVEVQFYLIFPFLAKLFKKYPLQTYSAMLLISWAVNYYIVHILKEEKYRLWINSTPTFFSVYANGMMAALFVVKLTQILNSWVEGKDVERRKREKYVISCLFTSILPICLYVFYHIIREFGRGENDYLLQVKLRYELTLIASVFIISCNFALPVVKCFLGDKLMKFLSGISFQLYIWHQYLAVFLKEHHIPFWEGEEPPNMTGDKIWSWKYMLLCIVCAFIVAVLLTYCFERPIAKIILKTKNAEPQK